MGATQAIPIVGELATLAVGGGKAIVAGACATVGQTKAAEQLIQGAGQTFKDYYEVNAVAANIHMAVAATSGDHKKVHLLKDLQCKAWVDVVENTPVVGHWIGVARYACGDAEGGDRCMLGASRSAVVLVAMLATGSAGALVCGAAAACSGLVYDGIATGCNSAAKEQFVPIGIVAGINHAVETGNANDVFDAAAILIADGVAGALHGRLKMRMPAAELMAQQAAAVATRCSSGPVRYRVHTEITGSSRQVSFTELSANRRTAAFVKEFQSHAEALCHLERGQKYYFVWKQDGKMLALKHSDAANVGWMLGESNRPVSHMSLVEPGTGVVAAGEIHIGPTGIIENINCRSGHFHVPLAMMRRQMGRVIPSSVLTYESPTLMALMSSEAGTAPTHVAVYTPTLIAAIVDYNSSPTPLSSSLYILAFHENTLVRIVAFPDIDERGAKRAYEAVPLSFAKVLICKPGDTVLVKHGGTQYVDMCREEVRWINSVFPLGCWRRRSKDLEAWFDSTSGRFQMRCSCRTWDGRWEPNQMEFKPEDCMENRNGKLVKLN